MKNKILVLMMLIASLGAFAQVPKEKMYQDFKNNYDNLSKMMSSTIAKNGKTATWDWSLNEDAIFNKYIAPHLNIVKVCEANETTCWNISSYKALSERTPETPAGLHKSYILANGSSLVFTIRNPKCVEEGHTCAFIWLDTNGFEDPNTTGRDFFKFYIHPKSDEIFPVGYSYKKVPNELSIEKSCSMLSTGNYCGAKLLIEGAMNY
ncbi:MAG: hypothetical protein E7Z91_06620 [Cyanobacteria bacterium SIG30]|nr:hypothetical protein [Cyanobacteria bacterium SIG30]